MTQTRPTNEPEPTRKVQPIGPDGIPANPQIPSDLVEGVEITQEIPDDTVQAVREAAAVAKAPENLNSLSLSLPHANHKLVFQRLGFPVAPEVKTPSKRPATYFILHSGILADPANKQLIREEIAIIANSRDFIVTQDEDGNLIIFSLSERGGVEKLFDIERSIKSAIPAAIILVGDCTLYNDNNELTLLDSSIDKETARTILVSGESGLSCTTSRLALKISAADSRVGKNTKLRTTPHTNPKLAILIETISRVSEELGGPDQMIGYEKEFAELLKLATDDETHILSLEADAGMGKSRIRTELLRRLPNNILCSIDPSDKNIQGSSLATIAKQLEDLLKTELPEDGGQTEETILYQEIVGVNARGEFDYEELGITLSTFNKLPHSERIKFAAIHPETVKEMCFSAMEQLKETKNPKTLFVLEDLHHADRMSEPHIIELIRQFSSINTDQPGKVLVTTRPNEMYQSMAFKTLKEEGSNSNGLITVKLTGLPMLREDNLGKAFAFHSLPPEIRRNEQGKDLKIGDWYRTLAHKADSSPWMMKSFMDQICEYDSTTGTYPNIIIIDGVIEIRPEVKDRITKIQPEDERDVTTYFQERLATLDKTALTFLQYIALMEEKLGTWDGIEILNKIMGIEYDALGSLTDTLSKSGYLTHDSKRGEYCKLQHENTREIVLKSIDPAEKVAMAKRLYELFKGNENTEKKIKYNLATIVAQSLAPEHTFFDDDIDFWEEYNALAQDLLQEADYRQDIESTRKIAESGLSIPKIQACLKRLKAEKCPYTRDITSMTISFLFNLAESSRLAGKFDKTDETLASLHQIKELYPTLIDDIRLYRIEFYKGCMQYNVPAIKAAHEAITKCGKPIPPTEKAILDILLAHFEDRHDDVYKIYEKNRTKIEQEASEYVKTHGIPSPQHLELRRICEAKNPYEKIRMGNQIDGQSYDDDVIMHPDALTAEDLATMKQIDQVLNQIERARHAHPISFDPHSELKIREQQAGVKAFLGDHDESIKLFAESWRIANQMGLNDPAARIAKLKGDTQITQALLLPDLERDKKTALLKEAIATYSNEGIDKSLSEQDMESSQYQFILRLQRIRATGILAIELHSRWKAENKTELAQLLDSAMKDFEYMNTKQKGLASAWEGMIHYYFMGYIGHIVQIANLNGIDVNSEIYDETKYPYMKLPAIEKAMKYADGYTDLNFGEIQRKLDGLNILAKALRRKKNHQLNTARDTRDDVLKLRRKTPTIKREALSFEEPGLAEPGERRIVERPEYEEAFAKKVDTIRKLGEAARIAPDSYIGLEAPTKAEFQTIVSEAINLFTELNNNYPQFSSNPEVLYQIMGSMGYVVKCAYDLKLDIDENIFDTEKFSYMKIAETEKTYEYAQTMGDNGEGIVENKSNGLFIMLSILQEKEFRKKKQTRTEKDQANLAKRKVA